jgi:hypothetical protein
MFRSGLSPNTRRTHGGLLLAVLALFASVGAGGYVHGAVPHRRCDVGDEALVGLERVLADLEGLGRVAPEELLAALLGAGPRGWRELSDTLRLQPDSLKVSLRNQIEGALAGIPRAVLTNLEQEDVSSRRQELELQIAMSVLEDFGRADDLPTAIGLATPADPARSIDAGLSTIFTSSLSGILTRNPTAFEELARLKRGLDHRLVPLVLRAAGTVPSEGAVRFLGDQLGVDVVLDPIVIGQLGRVLSMVDAKLGERARTYVLMGLRSSDIAVRREACLTLGRAEELEAVGDLIDLLSDPDRGVADNAYWALELVTRKSMDPDPERWSSWFAAEQLWWRAEAGALYVDLRSDDRGRVSRAIRELASHRLHRHEVALDLLSVLDSDDHSLIVQACGALAALRSRVARVRLNDLLEHPSAEIAEHAQRALEALHELP